MKSGLLLDVVVTESATILELLSGKDQALLIRGNAGGKYELEVTKEAQSSSPLLVLDFGLDIVDSVGRLHLEGDSLARQGLDEDLHLGEKFKSTSLRGPFDDAHRWIVDSTAAVFVMWEQTGTTTV